MDLFEVRYYVTEISSSGAEGISAVAGYRNFVT
jgi:hypothetical protein